VRILLIEHNRDVRDALQATLGGAGHEVVEADDAGVGLAAYQVVPSDLVMIDVLAPGRMAAPEFLRRLRRSFPEARVIAMAGRPSWTGVDPLAVTQGLGAARSIRMPIGRDELLRIVDEVRP
jgi:DNA-binding NtrC family response regulator